MLDIDCSMLDSYPGSSIKARHQASRI